jgi:hypothetical protein
MTEKFISELSSDKLHQYRQAARQDFVGKVNTDRKKSIQRAHNVQKADIRLMQKEENLDEGVAHKVAKALIDSKVHHSKVEHHPQHDKEHHKTLVIHGNADRAQINAALKKHNISHYHSRNSMHPDPSQSYSVIHVKEDVVPTNVVGGGAIAGANQDPPGPSGSKLIRRLTKKPSDFRK